MKFLLLIDSPVRCSSTTRLPSPYDFAAEWLPAGALNNCMPRPARHRLVRDCTLRPNSPRLFLLNSVSRNGLWPGDNGHDVDGMMDWYVI